MILGYLINGGCRMFKKYMIKIQNIFYNKFMKNKFEEAPSLDEIEKFTISEVENARSNYNNADEDTIDLAIYELMVAEERLNLLIKEKKRSHIKL